MTRFICILPFCRTMSETSALPSFFCPITFDVMRDPGTAAVLPRTQMRARSLAQTHAMSASPFWFMVVHVVAPPPVPFGLCLGCTCLSRLWGTRSDRGRRALVRAGRHREVVRRQRVVAQNRRRRRVEEPHPKPYPPEVRRSPSGSLALPVDFQAPTPIAMRTLTEVVRAAGSRCRLWVAVPSRSGGASTAGRSRGPR